MLRARRKMRPLTTGALDSDVERLVLHVAEVRAKLLAAFDTLGAAVR